jgi:alanine-alpha-ketoisovalerate/valine-pyruvate aminotransferase
MKGDKATTQMKLEEMSVDLTIYRIPASLIKEFAEKIVKPYYPEGVSPAIKDLMRKAIEEERCRLALKVMPNV